MKTVQCFISRLYLITLSESHGGQQYYSQTKELCLDMQGEDSHDPFKISERQNISKSNDS